MTLAVNYRCVVASAHHRNCIRMHLRVESATRCISDCSLLRHVNVSRFPADCRKAFRASRNHFWPAPHLHANHGHLAATRKRGKKVNVNISRGLTPYASGEDEACNLLIRPPYMHSSDFSSFVESSSIVHKHRWSTDGSKRAVTRLLSVACRPSSKYTRIDFKIVSKKHFRKQHVVSVILVEYRR